MRDQLLMDDNWTQDISELYRRLAQIAVPARAEQIATLLTLIPFTNADTFRVVELASGEGLLAEAVARAFPQASILALDYEASMRAAAAVRLAQYGERVQVDAFDMHADDWYAKLTGVDVVLSSLCIHHLDGEGKQRLFNMIGEHLSDRGVFLVADIVAARTEQVNTLFQDTWDITAEAASIEQTLSRDLYQLFEQERWNYYRYPDDFDKPSPLFKQLLWLQEAGFAVVDCFWMQAGHAIYGGYQHKQNGGLSFGSALTIAQRVLMKT